ncbi:hypothetical protein NECAME_17418 [Necator americanus]|uniref:Uncharacterized protein n=1 Tax=Necator americanus TaxID=51031 RepID=W2TNB5_NECAM|nr:hypothetical protein NECAME_17418 [Necator americanus]ETN83595.1 hypothetical protein NECAME_17418 [Necator americanus]
MNGFEVKADIRTQLNESGCALADSPPKCPTSLIASAVTAYCCMTGLKVLHFAIIHLWRTVKAEH